MHSLRQRMVRSYLGLSLIPLLISTLLLGWYSLYSQSNHIYRFEQLHATQLAEQIAALFKDAESRLFSVTRFQNFLTLPAARQQELIDELLFEDVMFDSIALLANSDTLQTIEVSRRNFSEPSRTLPPLQHPYIRQALQSGAATYSEIEIDPDTAEPHVHLALPLVDIRSGVKAAVLIARLHLSSLRALLNDNRTSSSELLYLTNGSGTIIAHHDPSVVLRGLPFIPRSSEYPQTDLQQHYGIMVSVPFQVGNLSLHLIAEHLAIDAFRTTIISSQIFLVVMLLALLAALTLLHHSIRSIVDPIELVTQTARAIHQGDLSRQIQLHSQDELGTLAEAFNAMTARLSDSLHALESENSERRQIEAALQQSHTDQQQLLRSLETKVKERTQELHSKLIELERTQDSLIQSEKMATIGRLVSGFAHELNTPIGIAVGATSLIDESATKFNLLLQQEEVSEEALQRLNHTIQEGAVLSLRNLKRAATLIARLRRFSLDQQNGEPRPHHLCQTIDDTITTHRSQLRKGRIQLQLQCDPTLEIYGDPGFLELIISNLLGSSLEHGFEQGTKPGEITIKVDLNGTALHIDYFDNGCGIEPGLISKVFDPFFTTKGWGQSSGLGLYICYILVTAKLNGTIRCQSEAGEGAHFVIDYPVLLTAPPHDNRLITHPS